MPASITNKIGFLWCAKKPASATAVAARGKKSKNKNSSNDLVILPVPTANKSAAIQIISSVAAIYKLNLGSFSIGYFLLRSGSLGCSWPRSSRWSGLLPLDLSLRIPSRPANRFSRNQAGFFCSCLIINALLVTSSFCCGAYRHCLCSQHHQSTIWDRPGREHHIRPVWFRYLQSLARQPCHHRLHQ